MKSSGKANSSIYCIVMRNNVDKFVIQRQIKNAPPLKYSHRTYKQKYIFSHLLRMIVCIYFLEFTLKNNNNKFINLPLTIMVISSQH